MPKQENVEDFKITPEMKKFAKAYRNFNKIGERLRGKLEIQLGEANQTRQMLQQVEYGMQMMMKEAPAKPTYETPEMDTEEQAPEQETMNPMLQY